MEKTKDLVSFLKKCYEGDILLQNTIIIAHESHHTKVLMRLLDYIVESIETWKKELNEIDENENGKHRI